MQVGDDVVQKQQEKHAAPEANKSRDKGQGSHMGGIIHGRNEQTPDGGSYHDAGGKTG